MPGSGALIFNATHGIDDRVCRMLQSHTSLRGDQERLLIGQAPIGLADIEFAAQVGVSDLHEVGQLTLRAASSCMILCLIRQAALTLVEVSK